MIAYKSRTGRWRPNACDRLCTLLFQGVSFQFNIYVANARGYKEVRGDCPYKLCTGQEGYCRFVHAAYMGEGHSLVCTHCAPLDVSWPSMSTQCVQEQVVGLCAYKVPT